LIRTVAVTGLVALAAGTVSSSADAHAGSADRPSVGTWSTGVTGPGTAPQPETVFDHAVTANGAKLASVGCRQARLDHEYDLKAIYFRFIAVR
jgi:hypothetical protein